MIFVKLWLVRYLELSEYQERKKNLCFVFLMFVGHWIFKIHVTAKQGFIKTVSF